MKKSLEQKRADKKAREESAARIAKAQAETSAQWAKGVCPCCNAKLRLNLSMTGWVQCEQFGAEGFRKDSTKAHCGYQGFMS